MNSREFWIPVLVGVLATPVGLLLGAFLSGGGHTLYPMILFLPYGMLLVLSGKNIAGLIALPVFALQFPLYGAAFGAASVEDRFRPLAIGFAVVHLPAAIIGVVVEHALQNQ